jgi:methylmalonyl-CoA mutase
LALTIEAARRRATLGEISLALEQAFGRYNATIKSISGVYAKETKNERNFKQLKKQVMILPYQKAEDQEF